MNSITRRKSAAAALCFFLLAICAVVWAASAGTTDAGEGPETALPLGNSFVRLSSGRAEAVCGGETAYSVPAAALVPLGDTAAAAWTPGGQVWFLGEGGPREAEVPGRVLGVFGADCPAAAVIYETAEGASVGVYSPAGEACALECEGFFPIAAAFEPGAGRIALLRAQAGGYWIGIYSLPGFTELYSTKAAGAAYTLIWDKDGLRAPRAQEEGG